MKIFIKFVVVLYLFLPMISSASFETAMQYYEKGEFEQAYNDFIALAKIGHSQSQFNLAVMYYHGQHVKKNIIEAYAWSQLAKNNPDVEKTTEKAILIIQKKHNQELMMHRYAFKS
ncbi:MAG: SEL1-like repeat protein [Pseudomonadota bacterium]